MMKRRKRKKTPKTRMVHQESQQLHKHLNLSQLWHLHLVVKEQAYLEPFKQLLLS